EHAMARFGFHLLEDPVVGVPHAVLEPYRRCPPKLLSDARVVAVAAAHALRRVELVSARQLQTGDVFNEVDQLIDGDELLAPDVERFGDSAVHQPQRALETIVDVGEAARLFAVAPDLDVDRT